MILLSLALALNPASPRHYDPAPVALADAPTPAQAEVLRIQRHLETVERTLRAQAASSLTEEQRAAREEVLDILHTYWVAGEFPQNKAFSDRRVPHFIDDEGTACAVGHLMVETGAEQMAREIATYENYDFVADLDHPSVDGWLSEHGLTAEEAGWIQPSYGPCGPTGAVFVCGSDGNTYECEAIAVDCAGVEVVSEGACGSGGSDTSGGGSTSTGGGDTGGTTGTGTGGGSVGGESGDASGGAASSSGGDTGGPPPGPDVIGPEICPAGQTTGGEGSESDTDSETSDGAGTEGPDPTGASASGETGTETPGASDDDDKGCSVQGHRDAPVGAAGLLMLGLFARRRRS